jgi:hypothetical protein
MMLGRFPTWVMWASVRVTVPWSSLTGAALSHAASGDEVSKVAVPLVITLLVVASYILRPAARRMSTDASTSTSALNATT